MKILLDGVFFADWVGTLEELAAFSDVDVGRLSIGPPDVPIAVPMRAARLALVSAGLFQGVDGAIQTIPGTEGDIARTEWEYSNTLRRDHPLLVQLGPALGLTDAQIDALFVAASQIP